MSFKIDSKHEISSYNTVKDSIKDALKGYRGTLGMSKANLMFINYNPKKQEGILKLNNKYQDHLKASFALIKKINNNDVIVRSLRTSGILKKIKE